MLQSEDERINNSILFLIRAMYFDGACLRGGYRNLKCWWVYIYLFISGMQNRVQHFANSRTRC